MNDITERAMIDAEYSLSVEGLSVNAQSKELCRELLDGVISIDEYVLAVKQINGVGFSS